MASNYFNSLSPSFSEKVIQDFAGPAAESSAFLKSYTEKFPSVDKAVEEVYENGLQGLDTLDGLFPSETPVSEAPAPAQNPGWTFITAPEDVSWDIANQASRIDIFGTNNPPVVAGSRGMRDLTLGNALVEGFVRGVNVEGKIAALEDLMNYGLNTSDGFVSVPVYQVWVSEKKYGGNGYFIIKDVKIRETMRDTMGQATRAYVDISLMEVPEYQVNSGRDQASQVTAGGVALTPEQKAQAAAAAKTGTDGKTAAAAAASQANQGVGTQAKPSAGASSAQSGGSTQFTGGTALPGQGVGINQRPR